jgi:hypothetical protein
MAMTVPLPKATRRPCAKPTCAAAHVRTLARTEIIMPTSKQAISHAHESITSRGLQAKVKTHESPRAPRENRLLKRPPARLCTRERAVSVTARVARTSTY